MFISKTLKFYKREDVRAEIVRVAEDREVAIKYGDRGFGKRPDVLRYESDVLEYAKKGATSFHCSEERWNNPLQLTPGKRPSEMNNLRSGWDLILDIDCKFLEYSKIAAFYTVKALKHFGLKSITCKFSGNKGFHIAVPFESFPKTIGGTLSKELFPEAPRRIATYIKHIIKNLVSEAVLKLEKNNFESIVKKTGQKALDIIRKEKNSLGDEEEKLNAEPFLDIDTILISSRHLFRMPYSFHEKSQLVSVPINIDKILSFKKEQAKPENVLIKNKFLSRKSTSNEANKLLLQAFDFEVNIEEQKERKERSYEEIKDALSEELFPPCIKAILKGLQDGRKRSVFILSNFLLNTGWNKKQIEDRMDEWNKNNRVALKQVYIIGQLSYGNRRKEKIPPPNCDNKAYYKGLQVCKPDSLCSKIRNPLQYTRIKAKRNSKT
ncbi:hypothetical protein CMO90_01900 [Candidatus Woesearchaeota archaeon]|nr:hypothetical protein [Candidatus Woesearchaeota archaeon]